jgi:hypothetical protein
MVPNRARKWTQPNSAKITLTVFGNLSQRSSRSLARLEDNFCKGRLQSSWPNQTVRRLTPSVATLNTFTRTTTATRRIFNGSPTSKSSRSSLNHSFSVFNCQNTYTITAQRVFGRCFEGEPRTKEQTFNVSKMEKVSGSPETLLKPVLSTCYACAMFHAWNFEWCSEGMPSTRTSEYSNKFAAKNEPG